MRIPLFLAFLFGLLPLARATTVVPPSFSELVSGADAIYRGQVKAVESRRVARADGGTIIKTFVTFTIERTLKGTAQGEVVLEFLGGTVDGETLAVSGMPKFKEGEREVVFVQKNGQQFCPLVAVMHGRYRVMRDESGRDYMARDNRMPLTDVAEVAQPMNALPANVQAATASAAVARALTPAAFESKIAAEAQKPGSSAQLN